MGLTVPKALGGAVIRNRIKRRLRELFRLHRNQFGDSDVVLNPRRAIVDATGDEILGALRKVMERTKR